MISVIVPVYNAEQYLAACIDSICRNSYQNLEIICINDGSRDNSLNILQRYQRTDSRIHIISNEISQGPSAARNAGLDIARGEWIAFVDADDAINTVYFESLLEACQESVSQADCAICGRVGYQNSYMGLRINPDDNVRKRNWHDVSLNEFCSSMLSWCFVWGKIYKREMLKNYRNPPDLFVSEDVYFNLSVLLAGGFPKIVCANAAVYYYRWNPSSITHQKGNNQLFQRLHTYEALLASVRNAFPPVARSVTAQVLSNETLKLYRRTSASDSPYAGRSKKLFGEVLNVWSEAGFISLRSRFLYGKSFLYLHVPRVAAVEDAYYFLRNFVRQIRHSVSRKK